MNRLGKFQVLTAACLVTLLLSLTGISHARAFKSPGFGGSTGLISTPTANTGWEDTRLGLDMGITYITEGEGDFIPKVSLQAFGKLEVGAAYDIQEDDDSNDLLLHAKFRFYGSGSSALAIGGVYQNLKQLDQDETVTQLYLAATYGGNFFSMPAETTIVIGKSFGDLIGDEDIDFSMGFDLDMLPRLFKGYVHWISDFSNYSYNYYIPVGSSAARGIFNTGARLAILKTSRFKFNIDAVITDALDNNRSFALGAAFGLAL